jgi:hypothetical protein
MKINNFIKIYDEILPWKTLSNLIRFSNFSEFEEGRLSGGAKNFNIRKTYVSYLTNLHDSISNVHWFCLLHNYFNNALNQYKIDNNIIDFYFKKIFDISILKYKDSGFYTWHVDHAANIPRTMSCILLLNNDYEGGNLCFRNPDGSGEYEIEVKPNRMIVWPSNLLYPHTVKPVTKGTRYSVVAWAL